MTDIVKLDEHRIEARRIAHNYEVDVEIRLEDGALRTNVTKAEGNISASVWMKSKSPNVWRVSEGYCVKLPFCLLLVSCSDGEICSFRKLDGDAQSAYLPKPRQKTYTNVRTLSSRNILR